MPGWEITVKYRVRATDGIDALDAWRNRPQRIVLVEESAQYLCEDEAWARMEALRERGGTEAALRNARDLVESLLSAPAATDPQLAAAGKEFLRWMKNLETGKTL